MMVRWCQSTQIPLHVLLTKSDKLKRGPAQAAMLSLRKGLKERLGDKVTVQTFSSLKRDGVETLSQQLSEWLSSETDEEFSTQNGADE